MSEPTLQDCINYMRSQIKQMEKHPRNYEFNLPYYRKTVELLEKAQRPHGEWIPCSERLPEKYGVYLATNSEGDVYEYDYNKFTVHDGKGSFLGRDVIAWMPLPKPYREEGDEK